MAQIGDHAEYRLGWVRRASGGFQMGRLIDVDEVRVLLESAARISAYRHRPELVQTLARYRELVEALDRWEAEPVDLDRAIFEISDRLGAWLESAYLLLDRTETRVSRMLPRDSGVRELWNQVTSGMFDEYPSYRLAYHLRQKNHQGLPPLSASYSTKARVEGSEKGPIVQLRRSVLLEAFPDWHAEVRKDLEDRSGGDLIEIGEFAHEHQANLNAMVLGVMMAGLETLRQDRDRLSAALGELEQSRPGDYAFPSVFGLSARAEAMPVDTMTVAISPLPDDLVAWFDEAASGVIAIPGFVSTEDLALPPEGAHYMP